MKHRFFIHFLRAILGGVFIFSAGAKIISIDNFELYIYSQQLFSFDVSSIIARAIISSELALGVLLISNIYFKTVFRITLYLLLFFSVFLAFKLLISNDENCNCFGELLNFNPAESLLKNGILIIFLLLIKNNKSWQFQFRKILLFFILLSAYVFPSVFSPPDFVYRSHYPVKQNIKGEQFIQLSDTTLNITEGKKVLAFFSMGCKYCTLAAHKISIIADKTNTYDKIFYIFFGDEKNMEGFWKKSQSKRFKYIIISFDEMLEITDGHLPSIYFVEKGYVKQKTSYRGLTEKQFLDFFR